jgi:hypothetical protein
MARNSRLTRLSWRLSRLIREEGLGEGFLFMTSIMIMSSCSRRQPHISWHTATTYHLASTRMCVPFVLTRRCYTPSLSSDTGPIALCAVLIRNIAPPYSRARSICLLGFGFGNSKLLPFGDVLSVLQTSSHTYELVSYLVDRLLGVLLCDYPGPSTRRPLVLRLTSSKK